MISAHECCMLQVDVELNRWHFIALQQQCSIHSAEPCIKEKSKKVKQNSAL